MIGIPEEEVRYNVDLVNEKISELKPTNTTKQNVDTLIENIKAMATIWNTIGGLEKTTQTKREFEELDVSRLAIAIESLSTEPISYEKIPFQKNYYQILNN